MKYNLDTNSIIGKDGLTAGMYPVVIYKLIRENSNENNKLSIDDITNTLSEYWKGDKNKSSSKANLQKTVKRNLEPLLYLDSKIHAEYIDGSTFYVDSGDSIGKIKYIWYDQELSLTDLQLLSDAVVYSRHLTQTSRSDILDKLMRSSGQSQKSRPKWFQDIIKDAEDISIPVPGNFYNKLDYIFDAIQNKKCLAFDYTFSGQNNKKYKVRSYSGVSPYRIVHENGIYYMVAARNPSEKRDTMFLEYEHKTPIILLEIHKLDKIHPDDEHEYLEITSTIGNNKNLQEIISAGYHPLTHEVIPFKYKENLDLRVNSRGLDVLIDHFGNRIRIFKRSEIDSTYGGNTPELSYTYDVTIRNAAKNDWYELLIILLQYPASEIELVNPQNLLRVVMFQMRNRLNRLGENFIIQDLNNPPRPVAKPPYNK